jgi:hypothetical protein
MLAQPGACCAPHRRWSSPTEVRAQAAFNGAGNIPVGPETINAYETSINSTLLHNHLSAGVRFA